MTSWSPPCRNRSARWRGRVAYRPQVGVGFVCSRNRKAWVSEGLGGSGAVTDLFGEDAQVLCGARESVWRCTAAAVEAWMTRVAGSGEAWMDPRSVLGLSGRNPLMSQIQG